MKRSKEGQEGRGQRAKAEAQAVVRGAQNSRHPSRPILPGASYSPPASLLALPQAPEKFTVTTPTVLSYGHSTD